jgi:hypothetical protein
VLLAGFGSLFVATALAVSTGDATALVVVLVLLPIALAALVLIRGGSVTALAISGVAGLAYSALGVWDFSRVGDFERTPPGSADYSGHEASLVLVLLAATAAVLSFAAASIARQHRRRDEGDQGRGA